MCGLNNVLAFKGETNHKRKEDILLLISLLLSVVSVRDMIENSPFFVAPTQYVLSFDQNLSSFNNQNL